MVLKILHEQTLRQKEWRVRSKRDPNHWVRHTFVIRYPSGVEIKAGYVPTMNITVPNSNLNSWRVGQGGRWTTSTSLSNTVTKHISIISTPTHTFSNNFLKKLEHSCKIVLCSHFNGKLKSQIFFPYCFWKTGSIQWKWWVKREEGT